MAKIAFIVAKDEVYSPRFEPVDIVQVNSDYELWYYNEEDIPELSIKEYSYPAIPKCLGPMSIEALETSGIIRLQQQPTLSLKGQGVFVAVIDTGIQITDRAFRNPDGTSRIYALWDQTTGEKYTKEELDELLLLQNDSTMPGEDEIGHGTFLASVACGSEDEVEGFTGAAPEALIIAVKLKPADDFLRRFYYIPDDVPAYSEAEIMAAVAYAVEMAGQSALVIMMGLGCNNGGHIGISPLANMLNELASHRHIGVVVAAGNEANKQIHYEGQVKGVLAPAAVEINVSQKLDGFYAELWGWAPERFGVSVVSPSGDKYPRSEPVPGVSGEYYYSYEDTTVTIDYRDAGRTRRDQLIFLRFSNPPKGVWKINIYSQNVIDGNFNMWLPLSQHQMAPVFFLRPNPDITITMPADGQVLTSVGGYRVSDGASEFSSGRGFLVNGEVKPDFAAPAVDIVGKGLRGQYITMSGSSAAAAITAGAYAQFLEWAVVKGNAIGINSVDIKNLFIRGCNRSTNRAYPDTQLGYGQLNIYTSFRFI